MTSRRKFMKLSMLSSAAFLPWKNLFAKAYVAPPKLAPGSPMVISTWDFGMEANRAAWGFLDQGKRAVDAVEAGVMVPEADPENQSVGLGGRPDRDGHVTLDACIMDEFAHCGAVAGLENIVHAISVARKIMDKTPHVMLVGEGALQFALECGFKKENLLTKKSEKEWREWLKTAKYEPWMNVENEHYKKDKSSKKGDEKDHDTIGMLALDKYGNLGGACTTSGLAYKMHGRVGDSPIIGAGLYVDNEVGAATSSGVGEEVIRIVGSHLVVEQMRMGIHPEEACRRAVERLVSKNPVKAHEIQVGFLALNRIGEFGAFALQKGFTYSIKTEYMDKVIEAPYFFKN